MCSSVAAMSISFTPAAKKIKHVYYNSKLVIQDYSFKILHRQDTYKMNLTLSHAVQNHVNQNVSSSPTCTITVETASQYKPNVLKNKLRWGTSLTHKLVKILHKHVSLWIKMVLPWRISFKKSIITVYCVHSTVCKVSQWKCLKDFPNTKVMRIIQSSFRGKDKTALHRDSFILETVTICSVYLQCTMMGQDRPL